MSGCLDCDGDGDMQARGLCGTCYGRRFRTGTLDERPPVSRREGGGLAASPLVYGISYRQLDHWCRKGYLHAGTPGIGSWRTWTAEDREVARLMAKLTEHQMAPAAAARLARTAPTVAEEVIALLDMAAAQDTDGEVPLVPQQPTADHR